MLIRANKSFHGLVHCLVRMGNVEAINNIYSEHINNDVDLLMLVTLLRTSSPYKTEIPLWSAYIIKSYNKCKELGLLPRKELWGLI